MKKENLLKVEALILMRELWTQEPNIYWSLEDIAKKLNCTVKELYDWDTDSGVLYELDYEGDVQLSCDKTCCCCSAPMMLW